jgi:acyl-CoA thioesterase
MGQVGKHGSFFLDSAVERSGSVYNATVHEAWGIAGNANGGYLMAIAARAMAGVSRPHPVSLTAHFLAPGTPGPVTIRPQVIKAGHRFTTVRASLSSEERQLVELLGSFSDLADVEGPVHIDAAPPDLPAPEDCIRVVPDPSGFPPPLMSKVDMRLHPEDSVFATAVDAFPPTIFNAHLPIAWTPTLELTAHVRGLPEPGWLRCRFSTRFISGGMLEEDGDIWDESGRLVAQSRQLALQPRG